MKSVPESRYRFLLTLSDHSSTWTRFKTHEDVRLHLRLFLTKAVHLELVSDLSTDAFLASFKRFVGRRGKPAEIFSDWAINFVEAKHVLKLWSSEAIGRYFANEGVVWRTNVPSAPYFGRLWEASVKSMKYYLKRVIGCQILNNEVFSTVLVDT
ncbi:uncharacterized protein LOC129963006 [Argiope bruennichi]|uniref:uncharacterized protein LOC129963006 n=1 Tax=Argiope bruennichi TaxID=94029 RepID=UPI0024940328|nr:uncharacterized protein LOC129963006 [Argiope bruennichi]